MEMEEVNEKLQCCLFCLRLISSQDDRNGSDGDSDSDIFQRKFFQLLKRYFLLNQNDSDSDCSTFWMKSMNSIVMDNIMSMSMSPCVDCFEITKSFCDYYEEIKVLEMKLQWRLQTLMNIVESSEKAKRRQKLLQGKLKELGRGRELLDVGDFMKCVKCFRTELVNACTAKFRTSNPRVSLRKCDSIHGNGSRRTSKRPIRNAIEDKRTMKRFKSEPRPGTLAGSGVISELLNEALESSERLKSDNVVELQSFMKSETLSEEDYHENDVHEPSLSDADLDLSVVGNEEEMKSVLSDHELSGEVSFAAEAPEVSEFQKTEKHLMAPYKKRVPVSRPHEVSRRMENKASAEEEDIQKGSSSGRGSLRQRFRCKKCWRNFGSLESLQAHLERCEFHEVTDMKREKNSQCQTEDSCEKDGTKASKLYFCKWCPAGEFTKLALNRHNLDCHGDKYGVSSEVKGCRRRFRYRRNMKDHVTNKHKNHEEVELEGNDDDDDDDREDNICEIAEEKTPSPRKKTPAKIKTISKPYDTYDFMKTQFKCPFENCDSFFYNKSDLDNHSRSHGVFQCILCDTNFSYAPDLARHELNHLNDTDGNRSRSCPHENCLYLIHEGKYELYDISHILQVHLKLPPNAHTCPVCGITVVADDCYRNATGRSRTKYVLSGSLKLSEHFKANHDYQSNGVSLENLIRCDFPSCSAYFLQETQLQRHRKHVHHHKQKCVPDSNGPDVVVLEEDQNQNQDTEEKQKRIICKLCNEHFTSRSRLNWHNLTKHGDKYGKSCDFPGCQRKFRTVIELRAHVAREHGNNAMGCAICTKAFSSKDELLFHQNQVHRRIQLEPTSEPEVDQKPGPDQVFQCSVTSCTEQFFNQESLQSHMKLHGIFKCQFCDEVTYNYAPDLALHELSSHKIGGRAKNASGEVFSCPRCTFRDVCTEPQFVQHHLKFHLDVEMVVKNMCSLCKFVFKDYYYNPRFFGLHYKTQHDLQGHSGDVFPCNEDNCGAAIFRRADQLDFHNLIVHNKRERNHCCEQCGEMFFTRHDLRKHNMRCHVPKEEWKHICEECGKRCVDPGKLREHQMSHNPDKQFACEHCGSMFKTRHRFKEHLKKMHGVTLERGKSFVSDEL